MPLVILPALTHLNLSSNYQASFVENVDCPNLQHWHTRLDLWVTSKPRLVGTTRNKTCFGGKLLTWTISQGNRNYCCGTKEILGYVEEITKYVPCLSRLRINDMMLMDHPGDFADYPHAELPGDGRFDEFSFGVHRYDWMSLPGRVNTYFMAKDWRGWDLLARRAGKVHWSKSPSGPVWIDRWRHGSI